VSGHTAEKDVTESIQHRCPRMDLHFGQYPVKPCDDCYSLRVTAERIPYGPSVPWHIVTPPGASS